MPYTRSDVTLSTQLLVDKAVAALRVQTGQMPVRGHMSIAFPVYSRSGSALPISVFDHSLLVRKVILTHKGSTSNLLITTQDWSTWAGGVGGNGDVLYPTQSYTFEGPPGLRFDLHNIYTVDEDGATAHDVLMLCWL